MPSLLLSVWKSRVLPKETAFICMSSKEHVTLIYPSPSVSCLFKGIRPIVDLKCIGHCILARPEPQWKLSIRAQTVEQDSETKSAPEQYRFVIIGQNETFYNPRRTNRMWN